MAWDYAKEFVKMKADYDVEIFHRVVNPPIRMKPRAGAKPTMPDGGYHKNDMEPERDAFGAFMLEGPPVHIVDVLDKATGIMYLSIAGDDAQDATAKASAAIEITPKPKTKAQLRVEQGAQAHKSELDVKDQQIADLTKRLDDLTARVLAGETEGDVEVSPSSPAANGNTGTMTVAKARVKG